MSSFKFELVNGNNIDAVKSETTLKTGLQASAEAAAGPLGAGISVECSVGLIGSGDRRMKIDYGLSASLALGAEAKAGVFVNAEKKILWVPFTLQGLMRFKNVQVIIVQSHTEDEHDKTMRLLPA